MKKIAGLLVAVLVILSIYNDMDKGTLPAAKNTRIESNDKKVEKEILPFFEHTVKPGDTVISVLDSYSKSPFEVPVAKAVEDFKKLNDGIDPQKIKFGHTYKFPDYSKGD
ncbi:LysM domain-containing protein [Bacillus sp. REN3]|uniref:LysM peptidoglycan-binding domain-containing protein n=1 Tax=Bacillus sp. REN3 TaxID=2802440 RepID=UPI001AED847A|nr:LysM domain-containing protein [Bacillus sp. REN3]